VTPVAPNPTRVRLYVAEKVAAGAEMDLTEVRHAANSPLGHAPNPEIAGYFRPALEKALGVLDEAFADGRPRRASASAALG
jgi:hypothetical protein